MRRRVLVPLIAVTASSALVLGLSVAIAGASAPGKAKLHFCAGSTKSAAIKDIKKAYDYFLNGPKNYSADQKKAYIEGVDKDPELAAIFDRLSAQNASSAATTTAKINSIKCTGKKAADVNFDLVINGTASPGLAPPGGAVLVGKVWKVSKQAYCDLSTLGDPSLAESGPCAA